MTSVAHRAPPLTREPAWWGMLLLIATEAALFALLLASYFYVKFQSEGSWPPDGIADPKLGKPIVMTVLLMVSSIPAYLAERNARRGDQRGLVLALAATLVLGGAFLAMQMWEYTEKAKLFTPHTNAYGSLFYTITGLHGVHVIAGLVLLLWTLAFALRGAFTAERHLAVQNVSLYWHFVHGVWLFVFVSLYLLPKL
jgi:heme/copper-type cytochrome/quinol oxidase subunit 3